MESLVLLQLWKNLSKRERNRLGKWLQSPFHNLRKDTIALFRLLAATPDEALHSLSKREVFNDIFPEKAYDNLTLNYVFSFLVKQIEDFFIWEELSKHETETRKLLLARAYQRRGLTQAYERQIDELETIHGAGVRRNADWQLMRYQIQYEKLAHQTLENRNAAHNLRDASDALTQFFLAGNIRLQTIALSMKSLFGAEFEVPLGPESLAFATEHILEKAPALTDPSAQDQALALQAVRLSYLAQSDPENEENFRRLKSLLSANAHLFNQAENHDFYQAAVNFALRRHNRGERPLYTREALDLYRRALEEGFLFESGKLPKAAYNNINRLACLLGEREFAGDFLERYRDYLPDAERENVYRFNLAIFHYLAGDFARVPQMLQEFEFTDVYMNLHAREMLLKSYFELEEWQALASLCDSFYAYLRRKKDLGYHRTTFLNLIKYIKKAMKPGAGAGKKARKLIARIQAEEYIAGREWILAKLGYRAG